MRNIVVNFPTKLFRCQIPVQWNRCLTRFSSSLSEDEKKTFFQAVIDGDVSRLRGLGKSNVDMKDDDRWTLMMHACKNGHLPIVEHLMKLGSQPSLLNQSGQTARELALFWKHQNIANFLETVEGNTTMNNRQNSVFFNQNPLIRHSEKRSNDAWVLSSLKSLATNFILMHKDKPIVLIPKESNDNSSKKARPELFKCSILQVHDMLTTEMQNLIFLGSMPRLNCDESEAGAEVPWFALDVSDVDMSEIKKLDASAECVSVYPGVFQLSAREASIVGQARALTDWHNRYKFCPTCGSDTFLTETGYKRICKDPSCLSHTGLYNTNYPRVDCTVISTVLSPDLQYCLLGRKRSFPRGMFTCLAGFLEPGEGIEAACVREVFEEVGVDVTRVEYQASQPWPMPSILMLGLHAYADSHADITLDEMELEEARWFSREEVVDMLTFSHKDQLFIPQRQAIAHQLIKSWVLKTAET